ncbi:protein FAR1-RELATED SEQUENCE 5-like [Silene latifolia]|uniref:protein FAR1-RELATED SEQUENCE 5-like n=1 Tax=Silene latifolia TaxID=37657 RepID=UPI003D773484
MEIVDITMIDDNSVIESCIDSNVNNNSQCSVTPRVGCGEVLCSNVGSRQDGEGSTAVLTTPTMSTIFTPTTLEQAEGFENVGATLTQFKNFQREVKCLLNGKDGHMFISRLEALRETKGLVFSYETNADSALTRIFWTNADSIRCYALFGDAISFDPTYGTNKYNMKFAPFTGIDNHKKSITFGCVLLDHENVDSFIWTFQQFLKAMGGKELNYIISDQDAGIINAVPAVFKKARHRFCTWHIMKKVTGKVGSTICKETDFLSRLNNVVWSEDLEPEEFEKNWAKVISEFSLEEDKWLTDKHNLKLLEAQSQNSMPETLFGSNWEAHAVKVYTHEVFFDFQEEVKFSVNACSVCGYTLPDSVTNFEVSIVEDANKRKRYAVEWSKNALRNPIYDLNGNLLENNDLTDNIKFGMSRVWYEIYATVDLVQ